ncbi:alpha/beta hydrolase family protein [Paenibacillus sp. 1P07SE]|uniref:alpha/beta hydrolase family protein n=1 Tax=Paenibacillus sp. 1P07SE TaxID=3132209 RepID=UPI0039A63D2C
MGLGQYASGYYDVSAQLPDYLLRGAREAIAQANEEKDNLRNAADFEKRRTRLKAYVETLVGGWPAEKTPLLAACTGKLQREDYEIRKIVYQSLPGVYVTANLYVPTVGEGPYPAVLFGCGHIEAGKAAPIYQKVCIELVQNGMVVLAVDPLSQGERMQGYDVQVGRTLVRWHAEHTYLGLQCELAGSHIIRYFAWDLVRAVDYLCGLEEIDAARIGMTGNSGGGLQTLLAMMLEDRLAAAAPCTYVTSRESYMKTGQPQDGEQILDGAIRAGMDYDDYVSLFAPKPVLIGAVESDFFCLEGTLDALARARYIYGLYGAEEQVSLGLVPGTHSFNDALRKVVVAWFVKQFHGAEASVRLDEEVRPERVRDLQCTASGQVLAEYPDALSVQAVNARRLTPLQERLGQLSGDPEGMKRSVRDWLRIPDYAGPIYPRSIQTERIDRAGCVMQEAFIQEKVFFFSEPDITVGGMYIEREGVRVGQEGERAERTTLLLQDAGSGGVHLENDWLVQLTEQGSVFAFDPRGTGAFRSRAVNGRDYDAMFGTEYKLGCDARMLGRPLPGMRVFDALRALDYIRQRSPGTKLSVAGKGFAAIYALLAGIIDDRVEEIYLENLPRSFADLVETRFYAYDVRCHWHDVLSHFDLPELIGTFQGIKAIRNVETPDVGRIVWF